MRMRLAKRLAQARLCSRRQAEEWIQQGRVSVVGVPKVQVGVTTMVEEKDKIAVDGKTIPAGSFKKLNDQVFLCYKLREELVTYKDPRNRPTLFDRLEQMGLPPNLIAVGRLDFMSEGLILLTTDGHFAREMELPENAILRKYRARVTGGTFSDKSARRLAKGITVEQSISGPYKPIGTRLAYVEKKSWRKTRENKSKSKYKRVQDAKVLKTWLDVTVTEGKYREVRRALESCGMLVDRLIRTSFGPYSLGSIPVGSVLKVRRRRGDAATK